MWPAISSPGHTSLTPSTPETPYRLGNAFLLPPRPIPVCCVACSILVPNQGSNPWPLQWKCRPSRGFPWTMLFYCLFYLFRLCQVLAVACELLVAAGMWDLVLWSGVEHRPPALGAWSLTHWTTRKVLARLF